MRHLAAMPLFTGMAVLTLALGIGANTAIFSVISGVLLKPLPYPRSEELVALDHAAPGFDIPRAGAAPFLYFTYREDARVFQDVAMWSTGTVSVTGVAQPEEVPALFATDGLLPILGVQPMLGRVFSRADDAPGGAETVVLTAGYWRAKFGGDRSAVGRTVTLDGKPREIIGVLPDTFRFLDRDVSLVVPFRLDRSKVVIGQFSYSAIARLKPGETIERARADATRLIPIALRKFPPFPGATLAMFEKARLSRRRSDRSRTTSSATSQNALWVLMGTIGMVLLIACANVANLLLVRAESRQQELAIKAALGADSRPDRPRAADGEHDAGGARRRGRPGAGLRGGAAAGLPRARQPAAAAGHPDRSAGAALRRRRCRCCRGCCSAWSRRSSRPAARLAPTLRAGGRTASASKERERARNVLVVAQVALALVLLVGSGLMIRTFRAIADVHPGFVRPGEVQTLRLSIPESQVKDDAAVARTHQTILEKLAAVPGVTSVALASTVTMSGGAWHDPLYAEDRAYGESEVPAIRMFKFVAPGYMKTLGGSIVAGRDFTWDDAHGQRPVAMVSANLAREWWGEPSQAIGKRIRPYAKGVWREVVGVVSDTRDDGVTKKAATVAYWPISMAAVQSRAPTSRCSCCATRPIWCAASAPAGRLRARAGAGGVVGQPEPAAGQRAHAAGDLRRVAGADVVHAGDAGDRRRDGAAARRRRHLRRHLLRGVAAPARDRHPHRARGAVARRDRPVRRGTAWCWPASASPSAWPRRSAVTRLMASLLFEVSADRSADLCAGVADAVRARRCWRATCRPCAPRASIR